MWRYTSLLAVSVSIICVGFSVYLNEEDCVCDGSKNDMPDIGSSAVVIPANLNDSDSSNCDIQDKLVGHQENLGENNDVGGPALMSGYNGQKLQSKHRTHYVNNLRLALNKAKGISLDSEESVSTDYIETAIVREISDVGGLADSRIELLEEYVQYRDNIDKELPSGAFYEMVTSFSAADEDHLTSMISLASEIIWEADGDEEVERHESLMIYAENDSPQVRLEVLRGLSEGMHIERVVDQMYAFLDDENEVIRLSAELALKESGEL